MPDPHAHMNLDKVAAEMRAAYNQHIDPGSKVIPWEQADPDKRAAWLVCARAAYKSIFGTEYPQ